MEEKLSKIEKDLQILEKKTENAAEKPLDQEIEELKVIRDRLQELKDQLPPSVKK